MELEYITRLKQSRNVKDVFFIVSGITMATIGLKGFLFPNHFLDGGAMGISLLLHLLTEFDLSIFIVLINLPSIFLGQNKFQETSHLKAPWPY